MEKAGDELNVVERQAETDLERFKAFIEAGATRRAAGAAPSTRTSRSASREPRDAVLSEGDSGKAGVSGKAVAAGAAAAVAGVAAAAAMSGRSDDSADSCDRPRCRRRADHGPP